ncbi:uncharacterized protein LOC135123777 [Zophobas morio]|uniref:uncharacterized protein LOC135123777 n=1 Tax=Zophobas morio TaxID=2755281 RepID=UPI0030826E00
MYTNLGSLTAKTPSTTYAIDVQLFRTLTELANGHDNLLIFGDFNTPHLHQLVNKPTRYRQNQTPSTLDLIILSDVNLLSNLNYGSPVGISDHVTLSAQLRLCCNLQGKKTVHTKFYTDYAVLNHDISNMDWETAEFRVVDKNTVKQTVPRSTNKPSISKKLLQMVCKKRALWKRFKNSRSDTDYAAHRAYSNRLSVEIKAAKRTYELRVANSKDPKILYKYIRNRITGPRDSNKHNTSVIYTESQFCSPGPDGITPTVLNKCAKTVCIPLKILMTQSFQNSQLPEDWRLAIVKPIFKKGDKFQAVNYRPISLTAIIAKIMESIISDEIRKFRLANNVLPAEQHGFVPKKPVSTNLLCAVSDWTKNFDRGVATDVVTVTRMDKRILN